MTALLNKFLPRRALLQALVAAPAAAVLFRAVPPPGATLPEDDEIVQVGGWILKRSDLA